MNPLLTSQIPYALFVVSLFLFYGMLVRRGIISGRAIIGVGVIVGVAAAAASFLHLPAPARRDMPLALLMTGPAVMGLCAAFCVTFAYRSQKVQDIASWDVGDTKIIVRYAPASRIEADALLLTTTTRLRLLGGVPGAIGMASGVAVEKEALIYAPVKSGKAVITGGGRLAVDHIVHAAVSEPLRPVEEGPLRRALENAAQQARKAGAETIAVPIGGLRGLPLSRVAVITAETILKQRRAFAEIVFIALDMPSSRILQEAAATAVNAALTPSVK